jgi:alginate O-acetyltransferase complex protein AlgJ
VKRFILKCALFLLPFMGIVVLELWVLPIDFSTFRTWEALKIDSLKWALPGYFYPNMTVNKIEDGDLAPRTPLTIKKPVLWQTDRFGYRKENRSSPQYDIVIIGDSNTAGSSLTQKELLSEVLGEILNLTIYPLSPASINTFLKDVRFFDTPPSIVVLASIEREITHLSPPKKELARMGTYEKTLSRLDFTMKSNGIVQAVAVPFDRMLRWNLLHYTRASLRRGVFSLFSLPPGPSDPSMSLAKGTGPVRTMLFLQGDKANEDVPEETFRKTIETIRSYKDLLKAKGIRFIFLPIPNKENIYSDLLPVTRKPQFLSRLISALRASGVETIDTQTAFDETRRSDGGRKSGGALLFHLDDSHWNGGGVMITADLLAKAIRQQSP